MSIDPLPDLPSSGGGERRALRWAELDAGSLPPARREIVGATWRERMRQEHLATGAFALLTQELAETGCAPVILSLVARAAADEVRHAEVCRRMAVALLGEPAVPAGFKGVPNVPAHPGASLADRALLHMVEMCCLSESLTAVYFTEMVARASHPVAKAVVESLLEDEIDHSRVGWAYLASRASGGTSRELVAEALPSLLDRTVGRALDDLDREADEDDPSMEAFGYLGHTTGAAAVRRALDEVIVPGMQRLGVDVAPAREWAALRDARAPRNV